MSASTERSDLVNQLKQVQDWGQQQASHWEKKQSELTRTIQQTESDISQLTKRLEELRAQQTDFEQQGQKREGDIAKRMRQAISVGLESAAQTLDTRNLLLQKQRKIRQNRVENVLMEPKFQERITEFRQFQQTKEQLDQLPMSYRQAILQHHQTVRKELEPIFMAAEQPLPKTDKSPKCIGIIASIDPDFVQPEAMAVLLPVPFSIYTEPNSGEDSLHQVLTFRCVGAITAALRKIGLTDVSINFGELKGYLSIQVWLGGKKLNGDIRQSISLEFQQLRDYASELQSVRLGMEVTWLDPELLDDGENP